MGKPSIFSREYDRKMKARKKRKNVLITCIIAVALYFLGLTTYTNWQNNYLKNKNTGNNGYLTNNNSNNTNNGIKDKDEKPSDTSVEETPVIQDKVLDIKLNDEDLVKIIYTEENGTKSIKNIVSEGSIQLYNNVSPSAAKAVILDGKQEMYLVDLDGNVKNISKTDYITTSGTRIDKASYLQRKPNFQWHSTPKFISEDAIVYLSQMPWFQTKKTIYKVDLNSLEHLKVPSVTGENASFGLIEEKGLKVEIDAAVMYLDKDGKIAR